MYSSCKWWGSSACTFSSGFNSIWVYFKSARCSLSHSIKAVIDKLIVYLGSAVLLIFNTYIRQQWWVNNSAIRSNAARMSNKWLTGANSWLPKIYFVSIIKMCKDIILSSSSNEHKWWNPFHFNYCPSSTARKKQTFRFQGPHFDKEILIFLLVPAKDRNLDLQNLDNEQTSKVFSRVEWYEKLQHHLCRDLPHSVLTRPASNRDTHLYPPHNNSSVHLTTTTYVRRTGRITMACGVGGQPHKTPRFHPRHRHPSPWSDPPKKSLGPAGPD